MFCAGSILALLGRRLLVSRAPDPFGPSAWAAVGYALWFWLTVTWMVVAAPDWMLSYFIPSSELPMTGVHLLFALCLSLAALSGHTLTAVLLQRRRVGRALAVLVVGLVAWFGLWGLTLDRYLVVGSFDEWLAGDAVPLVTSPAAGAANAVGALDGLGLAAIAVLLVRSGRRLRAG